MAERSKVRRHQWQRQKGGAEVCGACGVTRRREARVTSSVFGRSAATVYLRGAEVLQKRPPCLDERQAGLFDRLAEDEGFES